MKTNNILLIILLIFTLNSCLTPRFNLEKGILPLTPQNFEIINSEYDDYNMDMEITWSTMEFALTFSTNRFNSGKDFDFIYFHGQLTQSLIDGEFNHYIYDDYCNLLSSINSPGNEFGPLLLTYDTLVSKEMIPASKNRFIYATDTSGNLDIYCANYISNDQLDYFIDSAPQPFTTINSAYDDAYPSIYFNEKENIEELHFTSNRDGRFDIYKAKGEEGKFINLSEELSIHKLENISSEMDDKCPYISGNLMLFTSNRAGGFGGFDLYFSVRTKLGWSTPKNFGSKINSEYDEYRPIICKTDSFHIDEFFNDMMIFSSNRPGGRGGYDLYYVGISKNLN